MSVIVAKFTLRPVIGALRGAATAAAAATATAVRVRPREPIAKLLSAPRGDIRYAFRHETVPEGAESFPVWGRSHWGAVIRQYEAYGVAYGWGFKPPSWWRANLCRYECYLCQVASPIYCERLSDNMKRFRDEFSEEEIDEQLEKEYDEALAKDERHEAIRDWIRYQEILSCASDAEANQLEDEIFKCERAIENGYGNSDSHSHSNGEGDDEPTNR